MSTLHQLREGVSEVWENLVDGWQKLYRRATGAITRFIPVSKGKTDLATSDAQNISVRNTGWGVLAAEVFDDGDHITVRLETPGMNKGDFDVHVRDNYLVICGEKQMEQERREGRYHVTECAYGRFERAIPLPEEVDVEKANARYKSGVLRIELPKSPSQKRKKIDVTVNG